ncbi:MAG: hypothetical protein R3315_10330 [Woeseiaceae bacterium]|nr:hypothetical protein [Woeseiaceae bacterium]
MSSPDDLPAVQRGVAPTPGISERALQSSGRAMQQSLLLPPVPGTRPGTVSGTRTAPGRLWLCLCLPRLPLEAAALDARGAGAVFEEQHGVRRILMASDRACAAGVIVAPLSGNSGT